MTTSRFSDIAFSGHLGLTERAQMIAGIFNESAANAAGYAAFKQEQDDRASVAMTKAIVIGQSRLSEQITQLGDRISDSGGVMSPAGVEEEQKKLAALKMQTVVEKFDVETLKPQLDSLAQLFTILALAEAKMDGFDAETLRHTKDAKGHLMQFHGQMTAAEVGHGMQERAITRLEDQLRGIEADNAEKAKKNAFGDYLKSGPAVAAPMPAPVTAKFRKKSP